MNLRTEFIVKPLSNVCLVKNSLGIDKLAWCRRPGFERVALGSCVVYFYDSWSQTWKSEVRGGVCDRVTDNKIKSFAPSVME